MRKNIIIEKNMSNEEMKKFAEEQQMDIINSPENNIYYLNNKRGSTKFKITINEESKEEKTMLTINGKEIKEVITEELISILKEEKGHKIIRGKKGTKNEGFIKIDGEQYQIVEEMPIEEKKKQIHTPKDRDIKIDSKKIEEYGVKLIYHRMKDDSKDYRIYISYKENDKLKRIRLRNEKIDSISKDEKKMIDYYNKLTIKEIKAKIA